MFLIDFRTQYPLLLRMRQEHNVTDTKVSTYLSCIRLQCLLIRSKRFLFVPISAPPEISCRRHPLTMLYHRERGGCRRTRLPLYSPDIHSLYEPLFFRMFPSLSFASENQEKKLFHGVHTYSLSMCDNPF